MTKLFHISALATAVCICSVFISCESHHQEVTAPELEETIVTRTDSLIHHPAEAPKPDSVTAATAEAFMRQSDFHDRYAKGIIPGILQDQPDYAVRLLNSPYDYFIVVDKGSMNVILFDKYGIEVEAFKMACGKNYGTKHAKRDCRTPEGFFTTSGYYDSTEWLYTDDDGNTSPVKGQFGPRFIRVKNPVSSQIGIHGTCAPWSLGGRRSHGCIRIANENILKLVEYVRKGMAIIVNPGPKDAAVNAEEGYYVPVIRTGHEPIGKPAPKPEEKKAEPTKEEPAKEEVKPDSTPQPAPDSISPDTI